MEIIVILGLIVLNGVFSMSEIAMVSLRKSALEAAAKRGDKNAKAALETANAPNHFLSTVQIGITLIGILTGIFSGEKMTSDIAAFVQTIPVFEPYAHSIAVTIVVIIITFLSLVIGELVPKRIGLTNPEGIAKIVARPMQILSKITMPFVWLLTITTDVIIKIFRIKPSEQGKVTEDEIKAIVEQGREGGEVQQIEQDIVARVFSLGDRKISSLMTHRNDTVFFDAACSAEIVREKVNKEMHSVYPVYHENQDNVIGIVLLKDLFRHINDTTFSLHNHIKKPPYLLENKSAYEALKHFKTSGVHHGIVTDEYGQMQGLVTMNDLLEALVGDVSDFYATEFSFVERSDGTWLVDGQYPLADFFRRFDMEDLAQEYKFDTLSGLILHELRDIPVTGQKLQWQNFELEIVDMDRARIDKVLVGIK